MPSALSAALVLATQSAKNGVTYTSKYGAPCPWCGVRTRIYKTMPWEGTTRIRYHHCGVAGCPLHQMGISVKSVEVE
ncbi:MAG: transcriptional regulator [Kiritimatiellia bacterium]